MSRSRPTTTLLLISSLLVLSFGMAHNNNTTAASIYTMHRHLRQQTRFCAQPPGAAIPWHYNELHSETMTCMGAEGNEWSMLKAYVDGGKQGDNWKYTDDPNDADCMFNWVYYAKDKTTVLERVKGRTTISKKRWCALPVYQLGGTRGAQWEYCACGPVSDPNLGSDTSPTLVSLDDGCAVPKNALTNWNYNTRSEGPYNCTHEHEDSGKKWIMLNAYRSGGTKRQHWKYTTDPNDPACLVDWAYYDKDTGMRKIADIKGRITKMGDKNNRSWCPLRVYRPMGVVGFQWAFCACP